MRVRPAHFVFTCTLFATLCARADEYETQYLDGLRSRRLFFLAEKYCEDLLAQKLTMDRRAELAIELSRTQLEHGKHTEAAVRAMHWSEASQALAKARTDIGDPALRATLAGQEAVNLAHRATYLRWQSEVVPQDGLLREQAIMEIDKAERAVKVAAESKEFGGTAFQQQHQRDTLNLEQARMLVNRLRLERTDASLRVALAGQARDIVEQLSKTATDGHTRVEALILFSECCRERGDGTKASAALEKAIENGTNNLDRDRILAEKIRGLLYEKRPDEAATMLIKHRQRRGSLTGELHVLRMQALIELWKIADQAKNKAASDGLLKQMESSARYARLEIGGYWAYRCDRLLGSAKTINEFGADLAMLKQTADRQYAAGKFAAATSTLSEAIVLAEKERRITVAIQLYYQLGMALVNQKKFDPAADAFYKSSTLVEPAKANGHLMFAWSLGQLYSQQPTQKRREEYTKALDDHRRVFPKAETFGEATFMRAVLEERRLQNTKAIALYQEVPPNHQRAEEVKAAVARCYSKILMRLQSLKRQDLLATWQKKGTAEIAKSVKQLPPSPEPLTKEQAELAIYAAAVSLQGSTPDYAVAADLIYRGVAVVEQQPASPWTEALQLEADRWRLITAIASGDAASTQKWLQQQRQRKPAELFSVLQALDSRVPTNDARLKDLIAGVKLQLGDFLLSRKAELSKPQQVELSATMVEQLLRASRTDDAIEQAKFIAESGSLSQIETTANLIQGTSGAEAQKLARSMWGRVVAKSKRGTNRWLTAQLHVAQCHFALGEKEACRKILERCVILYPELGGESLKKAFERMQRLSK